MRSRTPSIGCALALGLLWGCVTADDHAVWADTLAETYAESHPNFVISPGDLLNIRVWNQDNMSGRFRVREDGEVSLLFINDVQAAGKTPQDLAREIEIRLKDYLAKPVVSVSLEEARQLSVSVLGEVAHPGSYGLGESSGVLQALASAGGLGEFAGSDRIYVLRHTPQGMLKVRFTMKALTGTSGMAPRFRLHGGDVVVVE